MTDLASLYRHRFQEEELAPKVLWFTMPVLLFWIGWLWLKASRDEMHDDPVVSTVRDPSGLIAGVIFVALLWSAA
ncbi:MAG: hypothetical protein ACRERV_02050 [Methylococcales bacterium]